MYVKLDDDKFILAHIPNFKDINLQMINWLTLIEKSSHLIMKNKVWFNVHICSYIITLYQKQKTILFLFTDMKAQKISCLHVNIIFIAQYRLVKIDPSIHV